MVVGEIGAAYDVVVLGGGPGGYTAAARIAAAGTKTVALIDRAAPGGVCLFDGCIPSKALIHAADVTQHARTGSSMGVVTGPMVIDPDALRAYVRGAVDRLATGVGQLLSSARVNVILGSGRLSGTRRLAVNDPVADTVAHVEFGQLVLATGSRARALKEIPFDDHRVVDAGRLLRLSRLPERLVVIGGGYIGVELGTAMAKLGVPVTIVEVAPRLLAEFPPALTRPIEARLNELGVAVRCGVSAVGDDGRAVQLDDGTALDCDTVLVSIGRLPNTDGLGLDLLGIRPGPGGLLDVGPDRRVRGAAHVWAIGDITPGPALAHKASAEAEVCAQTVLGGRAAFDPACIPMVVYSDPELVSVGATAGDGDWVRTLPLSSSGRAVTLGQAVGRIELVTSGADGPIIGAHAVGPSMAELTGEMALAVEMGASAQDLALTVHAHPTMSESLQDVARLLPRQARSRFSEL